jgi:hypothetical protein
LESIGVGYVDKGAAGFIIGPARSARDSLLNRLPGLRKIAGQVLQIYLALLAALDLPPLTVAC